MLISCMREKNIKWLLFDFFRCLFEKINLYIFLTKLRNFKFNFSSQIFILLGHPGWYCEKFETLLYYWDSFFWGVKFCFVLIISFNSSFTFTIFSFREIFRFLLFCKFPIMMMIHSTFFKCFFWNSGKSLVYKNQSGFRLKKSMEENKSLLNWKSHQNSEFKNFLFWIQHST